MSAPINPESARVKPAAAMLAETTSFRAGGRNRAVSGFGFFVVILSVAFWSPLYHLARYAAGSDLYSYILLLPLISLYLVFLKKNDLPGEWGGKTTAAWIPVLTGAVVLLSYWALRLRGWQPANNDHLSMTIFSWFCFLVGGGLHFLGFDGMRRLAFPMGILVLMAPFPTFFTHGLETFLQHASAEAAAALFNLSGETVFRQGLVFQLPGIVIEVARECSGIHSSLVLFITSLLAGHLLLRSPWRKAVLALAVIPLGIARNGLRIFTIGMLCVHVDPAMIDSPIHTRGGPLFFALSLLPFFVLIYLLRRSERPGKNLEPAAPSLPGNPPPAPPRMGACADGPAGNV